MQNPDPQPSQLPFPPGPNGAPPPLYDELRQQRPVAQVRTQAGDTAYLTATTQDVLHVYQNPDGLLSRAMMRTPGAPRFQVGADPALIPGVMMNEDGPAHTALRKPLARWFTPRAAEEQRPTIRRVVEDFADAFTASEQPADLVQLLAMPLPIRVISRILGIPDDDDPVMASLSSMMLSTAAADAGERASAYRKFAEYVTELIDWQRSEADVETALSTIVAEADAGTGLPPEALVSSLLILILAGHETTGHAIARGVYRALRTPGVWKRLGEDPDCVPNAVEEILRMDAPGQGGIPRLATEEVTLPSGAVLPAGSAVVAPTVVQSYDPDLFPDPHRFDIGRSNANQHLSFGDGEHSCLGAPLVRVELQKVFKVQPARLPGLRLADVPEPVAWTDPTLKVSGPTKLLVQW